MVVWTVCRQVMREWEREREKERERENFYKALLSFILNMGYSQIAEVIELDFNGNAMS